MDIGVKISGAAHAILIGIAIFGAPIFSSDEENPIQISEVSLISLEEFELLTKDNVPVFQSEPELEVQEPEPEPEVQEPEPEVQEPEPEPEVQEIINESDSDLIAPIADEDNLGELTPEFNENAAPKAAEIISDVSNEAPEEPADIGALEDTSFEKVNGADEEKLEIELNENTPAEESTTQIVTEAEEQKSDLVPSRTSKPKSRPRNLKTTKEITTKPKLKPKEVVEAEKDTTAESILESLKEKKEPEPFLNLTPAQKESVGNIIRNKMRLCWNPPVGVENGLTNVMILGLKFDIDGKLVESPVNLTPNSGVGSLQAFEAARRAVIRCSPYNELDPEIYDGWKELNLKFNPKNMGR
ncbi:cell envelope biogenesis protein TolA [Amylibacter sp.]|nr:cell envelope biogenesis protein TolA [Amylibacter sp.]MDC0095182.1 cell envelope biogenesis protein TolA [Amylibacter sp.]